MADDTYVIDVPKFNDLAITRLEGIAQIGVFDPRILADRAAAALSPTRTETVELDQLEVARRFGLVFDQIDDETLRAEAFDLILELVELMDIEARVDGRSE